MSNKLLPLTAFLFICALAQANAQTTITTLTLTAPNQTNTVSIADFQWVKVLTAYDRFGYPPDSFLIVSKPPNTQIVEPISANQNGAGNLLNGFTVAGPVTIALSSGSIPPQSPVLVTLEIGPGAMSVTNCVCLGPGQGAAINLESSTNLTQWALATNGVYTAPAAMFFRLHLQRIQ